MKQALSLLVIIVFVFCGCKNSEQKSITPTDTISYKPLVVDSGGTILPFGVVVIEGKDTQRYRCGDTIRLKKRRTNMQIDHVNTLNQY